MTQHDFLTKVATVLETAAVDAGTVFRDLPGWCSLQAFGLLVLLENDCGVRLSMDEFAAARTLGDLMAKGGCS